MELIDPLYSAIPTLLVVLLPVIVRSDTVQLAAVIFMPANPVGTTNVVMPRPDPIIICPA
jgi:hypothetical protein